jgi:hypothetical protein
MLNKTTDQYDRWQRERGTAYAEQQMRYKRQWEQRRSAAPVVSARLLRDLAEMEREENQANAQRQARLQRDLADDDRQFRLEQARFKHIQAMRTADGSFEGLACVYGTIGAWSPKLLGCSRFLPGCFAKARPADVPYWFDHDETYGPVADVLALWEITRKELPIAVQVAYPEALGGLVVVRRYKDTDNGKAARGWLTNGTKGISVSFHSRKTTGHTIDGRQVIDIHEADLVEVSDGRNRGAVPGVMPVCGTKQLSCLRGQYRRI